MMSWDRVKNIVSSTAPLIGGLIGGPAGATVGQILSSALGVTNNPDEIYQKLTTDPQALIKLKEVELTHQYELQKLTLQYNMNAQNNVTERWNIDSNGGPITKNIRPLTLIYLTIITTLLALLDGNTYSFVSIQIKGVWVELFTYLTITVYGAFFVGKSIERVKNKVV